MTDQPRRRHVLITGPGRSGTTMLVELLERLGLETRVDHDRYDSVARAGLEWSLTDPDPPYVVKNPKASVRLQDWIDRGVVEPGDLDLVVVAVRDLSAAARSRAEVSAQRRRVGAPGGLDGVRWARGQESELARQLGRLVLTLAEHEIPHVLLAYPRSVRDPQYCYRALRPVLADIGPDEFEAAWREIVRPELVHDYAGAPPTYRQSVALFARDVVRRVRRKIERRASRADQR